MATAKIEYSHHLSSLKLSPCLRCSNRWYRLVPRSILDYEAASAERDDKTEYNVEPARMCFDELLAAVM